MNIEEVPNILKMYWNIDYKVIHPELKVDGSPDRTLSRIVVEDFAGKYYIFEKIPQHSYERKVKILENLEILGNQGLKIIPRYFRSTQNKFVVYYNGEYWMIRDYYKGIPLQRPSYIHDSWRGRILAHFLKDLKDKSKDIIFHEKVFSLKKYIIKNRNHYKSNIFNYVEKFNKSYDFLEKSLFPYYSDIPLTYCHGDFHPMNVIWGKNVIKCVIDWEFSGYKAELYDIANLIGCVGIESPGGLLSEVIFEFLRSLRKGKFLTSLSWDYLIEFILAVRFAWLNEWIKKKDREMIELELTYMNVLVEDKEIIIDEWMSKL